MSFTVYHMGQGVLEVICGPMFSGKTEELIRRTNRAKIARQKVQVFRPIIDNRYDPEKVVSHSDQKVEAMAIDRASEILLNMNDTTRVVAIDEVQFFEDDVIRIVDKLARQGRRVICAGLDLDYRGIPFGPMPQLLAMADLVTKIQAVCTVCGCPASKTQRTLQSEEQIVVGAKESYEARCRAHYDELSYFEETCPEQREMSFEFSNKNGQSVPPLS